MIVPPSQNLRVQADVGGAIPKIEDGPWPAFPADLTSIALALATQAEGESVARIELPPDDGLGPAGRIDLAQRRFYKALGWFVLSLPAATLSYGLQGSYREAAVRGYDPGMVSAYETSYYAFEIAAAASAALAVNALFRLAAYIRAAR